jgi:hypothetical protein
MAGTSQGGLEDVNQERQSDDRADDGDRTTVENVAFAKSVIHAERLLQSDRSLWSRSFYLYHRLIHGEEQLSFAYA